MTSIVTTEQLNVYIKTKPGVICKTDLDRFSRILDFYGYGATQANITEFLALIINDPEKYKVTDKIVSRWKLPSSAEPTFDTVIKVCNIPIIKEALGDKHAEIIASHIDFKQHLIEVTQNNVTTVAEPKIPKKVKVQKQNKVHAVEVIDAVDVVDVVDVVDNEEEHQHIVSRDCHAQSEVDSIQSAREHTISLRRLNVYITNLRSLDITAVNVLLNVLEDEINMSMDT